MQVEGKKAHSIVIAEREALKMLGENRNPFCLYLIYAYEKEDEYCLVMPLAIGGDLKFHLDKERGFSV